MASDCRLVSRIEDLPEAFNAATDIIDHNLVAGRGSKVAIIDHCGTLTYVELADRVDRMAGVFRRLGIRREQRVLLCLLDTRDFPTVFLGAIKAGVVPVPLNTLFVADDYRWILDNSGAAAVFVSDAPAHHWGEIAAQHPDIRFISCGCGPWPALHDLLDRHGASLPPAPPIGMISPSGSTLPAPPGGRRWGDAQSCGDAAYRQSLPRPGHRLSGG